MVDLQKGDNRKPEYLALNPNGKVPTLVDGSIVLYESIAIAMYLADRTPGQTIYPTEHRQARAGQPVADVEGLALGPRARHARLGEHAEGHVRPGRAERLRGHRRDAPGRAARRGARRAAREDEWVCGETPTLADYAISARADVQGAGEAADRRAQEPDALVRRRPGDRGVEGRPSRSAKASRRERIKRPRGLSATNTRWRVKSTSKPTAPSKKSLDV